ncbi:hypothetical protein [Agrobacterium fabrum]|uniref:hypothetical protein n=1 Tax=Agrobacterium fabrum TaxID=1176649 RepID=UPI003BA3D9DF
MGDMLHIPPMMHIFAGTPSLVDWENLVQSSLSSLGFTSGEITTIAMTTIANKKRSGYKTSIARPLAINPSTLFNNPGLSTCIMATFSGIYVFKYCHRRFKVERT